MEEFVTRDIIKPIAEFILTCPFLGKYHIDASEISTQMLTDDGADKAKGGVAIESIGSTQITTLKNILGDETTNRQLNYQVWLRRQSNHEPLRNETANFLFNFEQWVEQSQFRGLCPKISQDKEDQKRETMWADGGMYFGQWEDGSEVSLYLVQLHISYYNSYKEDEED